jgi:hypothetical protein
MTPAEGSAGVFFVFGTKKRRESQLVFVCSLFSFFLALLEIAGPQDGKSSVYVKKFVLFER